MKVYALPLGDYQTNCYIVHDENRTDCFVVDPGYQAEDILDFCADKGLTIAAILLTHGHFDHVGAVKTLLLETECKLYMHEKDWAVGKNPLTGWIYPLAGFGYDGLQLCGEGDTLSAAGLTFTVLETPGHTCGSVCLRCGDVLFTGDTLFDGSCGRTDLPGGDGKTMLDSLQRLKNIPEDLVIYPGHGTASTLAEQRRWNPYLR